MITISKSYSFVTELLNEVIFLKNSGVAVQTKSGDIEWALKSPKNIAASDRPTPSSIIEKREKYSRF